MRCGATKRSIATAVSERASAAVIPTRPASVWTSIRVMKYELWTSPRPQAGRNGAGSGTSRTRDVTAVIVVGLAIQRIPTRLSAKGAGGTMKLHMNRLEERDLRSLERRSMYSIFAPLNGSDGLSRELALDDQANPTRAGELAVWGFLGRRRRRRRRVADEVWVPAMFMFVRRFS